MNQPLPLEHRGEAQGTPGYKWNVLAGSAGNREEHCTEQLTWNLFLRLLPDKNSAAVLRSRDFWNVNINSHNIKKYWEQIAFPKVWENKQTIINSHNIADRTQPTFWLHRAKLE